MAKVTNNTNSPIDVYSFNTGSQRLVGSISVNYIPANTTLSLDNLDESTKSEAINELSVLSEKMNLGELVLVTDITELADQIHHSRELNAGIVSGWLDNWNPFPIGESASDYDTIILNPSKNTYITGLNAPTKGTRLLIINQSPSKTLYLYSNGYWSVEENRFLLRGTVRIEKNEAIEIFYDESISRWRAITNS